MSRPKRPFSWTHSTAFRAGILLATLALGALGVAKGPVSRAEAGAVAATVPDPVLAAFGDPGKAEPQAQKPTHATSIQTLNEPDKGIGAKNAPITFEVFSDYECPSCANLYEHTLREMIRDYVASGKVYLLHRDFPLPGHKYSLDAARWANAAARIGKFQEVDAALYDNQKAWAADGSVEKYVAGALSAADFKRVQKQVDGCLTQTVASVKPASINSRPQAAHNCAVDTYIEQDRALGQQVPVQATPTYVIYYKGQRMAPTSGFVSWPILKQFFDSLMTK